MFESDTPSIVLISSMQLLTSVILSADRIAIMSYCPVISYIISTPLIDFSSSAIFGAKDDGFTDINVIALDFCCGSEFSFGF